MFGAIFNGIKARKQRKAADKEQQNALQVLGEQQTQLDNLFNSEYYGDYINRADNQSLLRNLRNQTQQQNLQTQRKLLLWVPPRKLSRHNKKTMPP